jgi:ATP-dependent Clp protease ATP-binding subunit ClpA
VLKQLKDNPHGILFIDEIHTIIGAGSASGARWMRPTC